MIPGKSECAKTRKGEYADYRSKIGKEGDRKVEGLTPAAGNSCHMLRKLCIGLAFAERRVAAGFNGDPRSRARRHVHGSAVAQNLERQSEGARAISEALAVHSKNSSPGGRTVGQARKRAGAASELLSHDRGEVVIQALVNQPRGWLGGFVV
jgi:hypothetical protein